jgi:RNA polymerase sigma-54 factor
LRKNILQITFQWLLNWQKEYFLSGEEYLLKPLILKDVAEALKVDISTVSRVVNQKYVQTRFGIIPLKKLFSDKINTQGESVSPFYVKERIKNLLELQSLTDEQLTQILVQEGIQIARRTVNKYRQEIHIVKI